MSIVEIKDGYIEEKLPMVYDEEREQENRINKENAKLLFQPKFIPFYPSLLKLGLNAMEVLIFGFMDFYIHNSGDRFYFTNSQLSDLFNVSEQYISNCIKTLKDKGLIECGYKVRANGGKIRFVRLKQKLYSDYNYSYIPTITTVITNNNNINNNNINNNIYMSDNGFSQLGTDVLNKPKTNTKNNIDTDVKFEEFRSVYPKKRNKKVAKKRFLAAVARGVDVDLIIKKAKDYATECRIRRVEDAYIKWPQGWLSEERRLDDYQTTEPLKNKEYIPL